MMDLNSIFKQPDLQALGIVDEKRPVNTTRVKCRKHLMVWGTRQQSAILGDLGACFQTSEVIWFLLSAGKQLIS